MNTTPADKEVSSYAKAVETALKGLKNVTYVLQMTYRTATSKERPTLMVSVRLWFFGEFFVDVRWGRGAKDLGEECRFIAEKKLSFFELSARKAVEADG